MLVSIHYAVTPCQALRVAALFNFDAAPSVCPASVSELQTREGDAAPSIWPASLSELQTGERDVAPGAAWTLGTPAEPARAENPARRSDCCQLILCFHFVKARDCVFGAEEN